MKNKGSEDFGKAQMKWILKQTPKIKQKHITPNPKRQNPNKN